MRIVPIALKEYFVNGIPISETIRNHEDIFDFCLELKGTREWETVYTFINDEGDIVREKQGRITRYIISGRRGLLERQSVSSSRVNGVNVGFGIKILNRMIKQPIKDFDLNYDFYEMEARKIINKIESDQLSFGFF